MFKKYIKQVVQMYLEQKLWEYVAEHENRINQRLAILRKELDELQAKIDALS